MAITMTRTVGAATVGAGLSLFGEAVIRNPDNTAIAKAYVGTIALGLIGLPVWASKQDGGSIEVVEGAFDGLAALVAQTAALLIMTPSPPAQLAVAGQIYNNGHEAGLAGSLADALRR